MPPTPRPSEPRGLRVAVRYRPAETEALVGGDWYDAVVAAVRLVMLSVGDVAGTASRRPPAWWCCATRCAASP